MEGIIQSAQNSTKKKMETTETTTHLIQNASSIPYMAQIKYSVTDTLNNTCDFKVMAIIDTGSPVSLIKKVTFNCKSVNPHQIKTVLIAD